MWHGGQFGFVFLQTSQTVTVKFIMASVKQHVLMTTLSTLPETNSDTHRPQHDHYIPWSNAN